VRKALAGLAAAGITGEVIVADNGSTDQSVAAATAAGARVVTVQERGYGAALMGGIGAARGTFVLMGDADDSYDFGEVSRFVPLLRDGYDLVQGCRLPAGGGVIMPGAMPWLHRWLGNPVLSWVARRWFRTSIHDIYCGMRAFRKDSYTRLSQRCTGMEFATEMIVKASLYDLRIGEVPITLHPDGRRSHPPHLRTFRDGWRTIRFFLLCSPRRLFLGPGVLLAALGLLGYALAMPAVSIRGATFDAHTLLFASLALLTGYQAVLYGLFAKVFAASEGLLPPDLAVTRIRNLLSLERGLAIGAVLGSLGLLLLAKAVLIWLEAGLGRLDYASTMRVVVPGVTLTSLGVQTALGAFLLSILELRRR
jgi:glycosyltransferase involved in cell wall biosynthesis